MAAGGESSRYDQTNNNNNNNNSNVGKTRKFRISAGRQLRSGGEEEEVDTTKISVNAKTNKDKVEADVSGIRNNRFNRETNGRNMSATRYVPQLKVKEYEKERGEERNQVETCVENAPLSSGEGIGLVGEGQCVLYIYIYIYMYVWRLLNVRCLKAGFQNRPGGGGDRVKKMVVEWCQGITYQLCVDSPVLGVEFKKRKYIYIYKLVRRRRVEFARESKVCERLGRAGNRNNGSLSVDRFGLRCSTVTVAWSCRIGVRSQLRLEGVMWVGTGSKVLIF
eukprot:gene11204-7776_t